MKNAFYRHLDDLEGKHISVRYQTTYGSYFPAHWHPAIELIYILNGTADITISGKRYVLVPGEFILTDSNQIHESQCARAYTEICVHVSRSFLESYTQQHTIPPLVCSRETLTHEQLPHFLSICGLFKKLVPLYINQPPAMNLATEAIVMEIMFLLLNHFTTAVPSAEALSASGKQERLKEIILYVEKNYAHAISLEEIASHFGLNREYFCRFFKQQMGLNFSRHVNLVRLSHIHSELITTDAPVMEIIERNGFTNYKLFHKLFREIYGCTPRELRVQTLSSSSRN